MSVYKSKRGESTMQFVETARKLEAHTLACCIKTPKRYSFLLTGEIMRLASEVHNEVKAANSIYVTNRHEEQMRRDHLTEANCRLQCLNPKLELLYDAMRRQPDVEKYNWIHNAMREWGRLICEEAELISKVKKADRQRYKNLPE